jgi:hypothetical protein
VKRFRVFAFFLGAVVIGAASATALADPARAPANVQRDYDQFIARFRGALKANDSAAVTAMTKFPFYWNESQDAAAFRTGVYGKIFTAKVRDCLGRGKGVYDRDPDGHDNFTIFCGQELYVFTRTADGFRFAEVGDND